MHGPTIFFRRGVKQDEILKMIAYVRTLKK